MVGMCSTGFGSTWSEEDGAGQNGMEKLDQRGTVQPVLAWNRDVKTFMIMMMMSLLNLYIIIFLNP